jgi:hypothetical protein
MSVRQNVRSAKRPSAKCPFGKMSFGKMSFSKVSFGKMSGHLIQVRNIVHAAKLRFIDSIFILSKRKRKAISIIFYLAYG